MLEWSMHRYTMCLPLKFTSSVYNRTNKRDYKFFEISDGYDYYSVENNNCRFQHNQYEWKDDYRQLDMVERVPYFSLGNLASDNENILIVFYQSSLEHFVKQSSAFFSLKRVVDVIIGIKNNLDGSDIISTSPVIGYDKNGILISKVFQPKSVYPKVSNYKTLSPSGSQGCKSFDENGDCQCWPEYMSTGSSTCLELSENPNHLNCLEKDPVDETKCGLCKTKMMLNSSTGFCTDKVCSTECEHCTEKGCLTCSKGFIGSSNKSERKCVTES